VNEGEERDGGSGSEVERTESPPRPLFANCILLIYRPFYGSRDISTLKRVEKLKTNFDAQLNGRHIRVEVWTIF